MTLRWRAPPNDGGEPITHYEYEQDGSGTWISTGGTATSHTVTGLNNGQTYMFRVRAVNALGSGAVVTLEATPSPSTGGGGGGGPRQTAPSAPRNLLAEGGDGQVKLTWEAPENDGGSEIRDYQYRIDGKGRWISIGSTDTTHTVTGLVNGTAYVFEVWAVNRIGRGRASNRAEATPDAHRSVYSGLRAFRQRDRHHLRLRVRECGSPSDPARNLLLRSEGAVSLIPHRWWR